MIATMISTHRRSLAARSPRYGRYNVQPGAEGPSRSQAIMQPEACRPGPDCVDRLQQRYDLRRGAEVA
jgi:hypothetical protein